jgi:hypothetical protein
MLAKGPGIPPTEDLHAPIVKSSKVVLKGDIPPMSRLYLTWDLILLESQPNLLGGLSKEASRTLTFTTKWSQTYFLYSYI